MDREEPLLPPDNSSINSINYENELAASLSNSLSSLHRFDRLTNEAVIMGSRTEGRMPVVRRNFCLFVLFDLLLVFFIWLIIAMLSGNGDLANVLEKEVGHYSIRSSLFDTVMAAACRFTVLLLFYGLLQLNTIIFVAITTLGTCCFLIAKALYYDWAVTSEKGIQGSALLVSLILCWIEVWFLELRVIPLEQQARDVFTRNDLIRSESQRIARDHCIVVNENLRRTLRDALQGRHESPGTIFHTPQGSRSASDNEEAIDDPDVSVPRGNTTQAKNELGKWYNLGKTAKKQVSEVLSSARWVPFDKRDQCTVSSTNCSRHGDYFKVETVIKGRAQDLHKELFENIEGMLSWNQTLEECNRIVKLNKSYDILYQVTKKVTFVSQRDFVILRRSCFIGNQIAIVYVSTIHPNFPERRNVVRARCGPSCWAFQEIESGICHIIGVMNVDLKLTVSKSFIRKQISKSLLDVVTSIRRVADKL